MSELERELAEATSQLETLRGKWLYRLYGCRPRWSWLLTPFVLPVVGFVAATAWAAMLLTRAGTRR